MFGFPEVTHKTFDKNFLKTIIFQFIYNENQQCDDKKEKIIDIFKENYPIIKRNVAKGFEFSFKKDETPIIQPIKDKEGLELKSKDGQKIITVDKTTFTYTVNGDMYKDYKNLKDEILENVQKFLEVCQITAIKRVAIRKINIFEFKKVDDPTDVQEFVITPELNSNLGYYPNRDKIKQNIQTLNYEAEDWRLNLKYGLITIPNSKENNGQIVIDIDLFNVGNNESKKLFEITDQINREIYNIFNWVLSKEAMELLNV